MVEVEDGVDVVVGVDSFSGLSITGLDDGTFCLCGVNTCNCEEMIDASFFGGVGGCGCGCGTLDLLGFLRLLAFVLLVFSFLRCFLCWRFLLIIFARSLI